MRPFEELTHAGQLARLRRLALAALSQWGLKVRRLTALNYWENATWRVDADEGRFLLRVHRPGYHSLEAIRGELRWLLELSEAGFTVQHPRPTPDLRWTVTAAAAGVPGPRHCTLLSWMPGRFLKRGLRRPDCRRLGGLMGRLHAHAERWRPRSLLRDRWDARGAFRAPIRPAEPAVQALLSEADWALLERAGERLRAVMAGLGQGRGTYGLIHADLHFDNLLFHQDTVAPIDFDDAGWGYYAQDLSVPLHRLGQLEAGAEGCQQALLEGYAAVRRPPPPEAIRAFQALGMVMMPRWYAARQGTARVRARTPRALAWCVGQLRAYLEG